MKQGGSLAPMLVVAAVILVAVGLYANLGREGGGERWWEPDTATGGDDAAAETSEGERRRVLGARTPAIEVDPPEVDLGVISPCGAVQRVRAVLRNIGDGPLEVAGWRATCACLVVEATPGFVIEPGGEREVSVRVDPFGFGSRTQRVDFRILDEDGASNALGARLRIDYAVTGALRMRPSVVSRPAGAIPAYIDIDRVGPDGEPSPEPFEVLSVFPPVATILPPLYEGHGAVEVDYGAIDELAAREGADGDPAFEWIDTAASGRRWRSFEFTIRTSVESCGELRVRVLN